MKAELTFSPEIVEAIAERVAEKLKPLLSSEGDRNASSEDRYLTVKELSAYIGLSKSWIYNNLNKLPHHTKKDEGAKKGKPLFKKSEIDGWMETFKERSQQTNPSCGRFRQQKNGETTS